jgi:hypothetical protein
MVLISLAGCLPDRDRTLSDCRKEADRFYQVYRLDEPESPRTEYIIECMAAKGYNFTVEPKDCDNRYRFETQSACYVSDTWIVWLADQFRRVAK